MTDALPLDVPGHVPWRPEPSPDTNLFAARIERAARPAAPVEG